MVLVLVLVLVFVCVCVCACVYGAGVCVRVCMCVYGSGMWMVLVLVLCVGVCMGLLCVKKQKQKAVAAHKKKITAKTNNITVFHLRANETTYFVCALGASKRLNFGDNFLLKFFF